MWTKVRELASLELMFALFSHEDALEPSILVDKMQEKQVALPDSFCHEDIADLTKRNLNNARSNINLARKYFFDHMGGYMQIKEEELLYEWLEMANGVSDGRRLEANIWGEHKHTGQKQLHPKAFWKLRHILYDFNLSIHVLSPLWGCFYPLIMDRPITKDIFAAAGTIWNNISLVNTVDRIVHRQKFQNAIVKLSRYGFRRQSYMSTDDSKYFKSRNHHVALMSTFNNCDTSD